MDRTLKNGMEDDKKTGWFHCGRCGAFFSADAGAGTPGECPECGRDPVIEESEAAFARSNGSADGDEERASRSEEDGGKARRRGKTKKKPRSGLAVFVGIWLFVLLLIAGVVKYFQGSKDDDTELGFDIASEDQTLVSTQFSECRRKVVEFLGVGAPERRIEHVMNPGKIVRRLGDGKQDSAYSAPESEPEKEILNVIETPKGKAIETVWGIEGGRKIEAVFFTDESGEWKIDWSNLVRYSGQEWPLYLLGSGADEGEFRLLARRRSDDLTGKGKVSSVVLVGPRHGFPGELGASSPEVAVDPDTRIGRILSAAFAKLDAREGIYGSQAYELDPSGMIRLRVRLAREEGDEGRQTFVIQEILACHWYDFDDLGLDE
jgi:hypothetical protein